MNNGIVIGNVVIEATPRTRNCADAKLSARIQSIRSLSKTGHVQQQHRIEEVQI